MLQGFALKRRATILPYTLSYEISDFFKLYANSTKGLFVPC